MVLRWMLVALAILVVSFVSLRNATRADDDDYMRRMHYECDRGDRRACVRFGIILGEHRERHEEWRHAHPEYWWWDR